MTATEWAVGIAAGFALWCALPGDQGFGLNEPNPHAGPMSERVFFSLRSDLQQNNTQLEKADERQNDCESCDSISSVRLAFLRRRNVAYMQGAVIGVILIFAAFLLSKLVRLR